MSDQAERLRELADTLDECEWNHPLGAADLCREVADNFIAVHEALEMLISVQNVSGALPDPVRYPGYQAGLIRPIQKRNDGGCVSHGKRIE